jgi:hypothetical protein
VTAEWILCLDYGLGDPEFKPGVGQEMFLFITRPQRTLQHAQPSVAFFPEDKATGV